MASDNLRPVSLLIAVLMMACHAPLIAGQDVSSSVNPSEQTIPAVLMERRNWTPAGEKPIYAAISQYDATSKMVTFHQARRGADRMIKLPLSQLIAADRQLIRKALALSNEKQLPVESDVQANAIPVGSSTQTESGQADTVGDLKDTEYWKAVQRLLELLDEIEEAGWESEYNRIAASVYDAANQKNAEAQLESAMRSKDPSGTTLQVTADLNQRLLARIGWDPDLSVRKKKKQDFEIEYREFDEKARALPIKTRQTNPKWHEYQDKKTFAKKLAGNTNDLPDTFRAYQHFQSLYTPILEFEDQKQRSDWFSAKLEQLSIDHRKLASIADRVRAPARHEEAKKIETLKQAALQNEWRDLVDKHGGSESAWKDEAKVEPFFIDLEKRCLKNRQLAGQPIRLMAPKWPSSSRYDNGFPIAALVISGEFNQESLAEIRRVPMKKPGTSPDYARDLNEIPGAKYAYFENGIDVWYGPVRITMSNTGRSIKGYPQGDEQAQIKLLTDTLDLPEFVRVLELATKADAKPMVQQTVNPIPAANAMEKARALVIGKATWTNRMGKTAQMQFSKLDQNRKVVTFIIQGGKPFSMKIDDLSKNDQELLLKAHGLKGQ